MEWNTIWNQNISLSYKAVTILQIISLFNSSSMVHYSFHLCLQLSENENVSILDLGRDVICAYVDLLPTYSDTKKYSICSLKHLFILFEKRMKLKYDA